MQILSRQLNFLANRKADSVNCIKIEGHVALPSSPTLSSLAWFYFSFRFSEVELNSNCKNEYNIKSSKDYCHTLVLPAQFTAGGHFVCMGHYDEIIL